MKNLEFENVFPFYTLIPVGVLLSILYMFILPANSRWILLPSGILISLGIIMQICIIMNVLEFAWVGIPIAILCGYLMLKWSGENSKITNQIFLIVISASSLIILLILLQFYMNNAIIFVFAIAFLAIGVYVLFIRK